MSDSKPPTSQKYESLLPPIDAAEEQRLREARRASTAAAPPSIAYPGSVRSDYKTSIAVPPADHVRDAKQAKKNRDLGGGSKATERTWMGMELSRVVGYFWS